MPQHDFNVANQLFPPTRADLNNALMSLASNSSGTSAPGAPIAGQWWADTTNNVMKFRNAENDAWIELFLLSGDDAGTIVQPVTIEAVPVGTIVAWPGLLAPDKWALCDGSLLIRADYPGLFATLGTRFNTGSETIAQFRLPDLRGRTLVGRDDMGGVAAGRVSQSVSGVDGLNIGATGGHQALQQHQHPATLAPHTHPVVDPGHVHNLAGALIGYASSGLAGDGTPPGFVADETLPTATNISIGEASPALDVAAAGTGNGQNMQPSMVMNWIIFTGGVGAPGDGGGGSSLPGLGALEAREYACSDETSAITGTGVKLTVRWPYEFVPLSAKITLNSACATGTFTVTVTVNAAALFTTQLTIDATEKTSKTAAIPAVLALDNIPDDAEVIITASDIGDGTATGLKFVLYGYQVIN